LKRAVSLDPRLSDAHRELGVTYGKWGKLELAVNSLEEAVRLALDDPETLRNSGGALRRWALREAPNSIDFDALGNARKRYDAATKREPYDTYSLLNVSKLDLMLSKVDKSRLPTAMEQYNKLKPLCEFNVAQSPKDPWRRFDLSESHLFSQDPARFHDLYREGIDTVPQEHCKSYLTSVASPLQELLTLQVLSGDLKARVEEICRLLDERIQADDCGG
jgi:tetratricopeptide (TPR) repeat protein